MSTSAYDPERLNAMLTRLKLTAIRARLDSLLEEAARGELNLREALAYLCEAEIAHKDQRRIQMGLSIAKLPFVRTLEHHRLRLRGPTRRRPGTAARARHRALDRQWRRGAATRPARCRQDPPRRRLGPRVHRARLLGAVHHRHRADERAQPGTGARKAGSTSGSAITPSPGPPAAHRRRAGLSAAGGARRATCAGLPTRLPTLRARQLAGDLQPQRRRAAGMAGARSSATLSLPPPSSHPPDSCTDALALVQPRDHHPW